MTWASNVSGEVLPVEEASALCRARGVFFAVDAAQAIGHLPICSEVADAVIFAGHKGLGGPQGVGGVVIGDGVSIAPWVRGGSGGRSESLEHPALLPWSQEAGTSNGAGIAGLGAALREIGGGEVARRHEHIGSLRGRLVAGLGHCERVRLTDLLGDAPPVGVVSFQIRGMRPSTVAELLEERFDILVRSGLHCAPLAHRTLGSGPQGTVRMSIGPDNTEGEIDTVIDAINSLAAAVGQRGRATL